MQISPINAAKNKPSKNLSFMEATQTIYKSEGMRGFMRGLVPSLIKSTLTSGTYFSTLFFFEENLKKLGILNPSQV
jgi:hypothetical protein